MKKTTTTLPSTVSQFTPTEPQHNSTCAYCGTPFYKSPRSNKECCCYQCSWNYTAFGPADTNEDMSKIIHEFVSDISLSTQPRNLEPLEVHSFRNIYTPPRPSFQYQFKEDPIFHSEI